MSRYSYIFNPDVEIYNSIPFTLSYKGIELDFEVDAKDWDNVADYAYDLIVDNMKLWRVETLTEEEFDDVVLDFKVILRDDWYRMTETLCDVYYTKDPYEEEDFFFEKGVYTLRYIIKNLMRDMSPLFKI